MVSTLILSRNPALSWLA